MSLKSGNISLRAIEPSDINILFSWENDTQYWVLSNTMAPYSKHVLNKYLDNAHLDIYEAKQLRMVIEVDGIKPIGLLDLFEFDPFHMRAGVGILIADNNEQGKGYATEALKILIDYSFAHLQLKQLFCNITTDNERSIKLFEKVGFTCVGTKKSWLKTYEGWKDENLYQLINTKFDIE
jgi:diamine N-acetyltransferase